MRLKKIIYFIFFLVLLDSSCVLNDVDETTNVVAEEVLYVSGDNARFIGRILSIGPDPILDHGFEISIDSDFIREVLIISLGETNKLGKFIGNTTSLIPSTQYYYRAFILSTNLKIESESKMLTTLNVSLETFEPRNAKEGDVISIFGRNFARETEVYFDNTKAEVISIDNESQIKVKVPKPIRSEAIISIKYNDKTIKFDLVFDYIIGKWSTNSKFISDVQLFEAFGIIDNDEFLFGFGRDYDQNLNDTIWAFDLISQEWGIKSIGLGYGRGAFNVGNIWGTGAEQLSFGPTYILNNNVRQYANGIITQLNDLPFKLYKSIGVNLDGELYVLGGLDENQIPNTTIYRYDKFFDSWSVLTTNGPSVISDAANFFYKNFFYYLENDRLLRFNLSSFESTELSNYPGREGKEGLSCIINNKAYIGLFSSGVEMWEYNIDNDEWIQKKDFNGNHREAISQYFVFESNIYVLRSKYQGGSFDSDKRMDMWKFNPNEL